MSYAVLIQIYDEANKLVDCLESLLNQSKKPAKIIIVDDGTPNGTVYRTYYTWNLLSNYPNFLVEYCYHQ